MRTTIFAVAAFAASALAVPMEKKRAVVTETNEKVVYVTQYTTVTGGSAPAPTEDSSNNNHYGHVQWGNHPWGGWGNKGHKHKTKTQQKATWEPSPSPKPSPTKETTTWAAPTTSSAPSGGSGSAPSGNYQQTVVTQHNVHRANHSAPDIVWDQDLANIAQQIANTCVYEHNTEMGGGGYGQNIAAGVDADGIDRVITDMFYNGEVEAFAGLYGEAQPSMANFESWGHFSQIVWKNSGSVGCATKHCSGGLGNTGSNVPPYFTVCNYKAPGNFANEYGANIGRPLGHPTISFQN